MKTTDNIKEIISAIKLGAIVLVSVAVITSCNPTKTEEAPLEDTEHYDAENNVTLTSAQYRMADIKLGSMERKTLSNVLKVNGVMDVPPQNLISVSAPLGGFVHTTKMIPGMKVKKGQVLAVLEHQDYVQLQQDYIDKKSSLEYLELEYKRQQELNTEQVNSDKVFQRAKSDYMSMKAQVKGLAEKLGMIGIDVANFTVNDISRKVTITAPINGHVSVVNVNIGTYVNPSDVMFEIINTDHLHAELTVYEKDVVKLKIGQKVRFTLPNEGEQERFASIHLIGRKIDEDRSVRVHAHLKTEDPELLPGMYINALIELNENEVNCINKEAVVMSEGKFYVFHLDEKHENEYHFKMLEVNKGVSENGYTEIKFIHSTDLDQLHIVTKGAYSLLAAMKNVDEEGGGHGH